MSFPLARQKLLANFAAGTHCRSFPASPFHHLRCRWLTGAVPAFEAQPVDDSLDWRLRWRCDGADHLHG